MLTNAENVYSMLNITEFVDVPEVDFQLYLAEAELIRLIGWARYAEIAGYEDPEPNILYEKTQLTHAETFFAAYYVLLKIMLNSNGKGVVQEFKELTNGSTEPITKFQMIKDTLQYAQAFYDSGLKICEALTKARANSIRTSSLVLVSVNNGTSF